jgi:ferrous iron transport protein B
VRRWTHAADRIFLHPVAGFAILLALLFVMFQAVYAWAAPFADGLEAGIAVVQQLVVANVPDGFLRGLIVEGLLGGVGSVVVFLPQIVILFLFILLLEASGYMTRAAFLMDGLMAKVGLSGRGFIPLLSSFACAIPGIMATRAIPDAQDRLTTILVAPLMTCSARLPVYALIIGAFIPEQTVAGSPVGLQGLILFGLYIFGIVGALVVALVLRRTVTRGNTAGMMMELPRYQIPRFGDVLLGLWQRAWAFLKRAGTIILATTVVLWLLLTYPKVPPGSAVSQVDYSIAGRIASGLEVVVAPIGFNHDIALALIPAMAAREVAVAALATANAVDAGEDEDAVSAALGDTLAQKWSLATALAFLAWFVFAPQCISTIAVTRRETNGWKWPLFMVGYLFLLAYAAAGITYWTAVALGLG